MNIMILIYYISLGRDYFPFTFVTRTKVTRTKVKRSKFNKKTSKRFTSPILKRYRMDRLIGKREKRIGRKR